MQLELAQRTENSFALAAGFAKNAAWLMLGSLAVLSYVYLLFLNYSTGNTHVIDLLIAPMIILVPLIVGRLILRQHSGHMIGLLFVVMAVTNTLRLIATAAELFNEMQAGPYATWIEAIARNVEQIVWIPGVFIPIAVMPFFFPDGKLLSSFWRIPVAIALANLIWMGVAITLHPWPWPYMGVYETRVPNGIPGSAAGIDAVTQVLNFLMLPLVILIPAALFFRYRHVDEVGKRQMKWPFAATLVIFVYGLVTSSSPQVALWDKQYGYALTWAMAMLFPISVGIAILRHHLFDIDIFINRALVYGILTASIIGIYIAITSGLGLLIHTRTSLLSGLIATAIVAVIFQPLRAWLQNIVNRALYGQRDDPTAVLSQLAHRLETADTSAAILPDLLQTIAETLKIPYLAICSAGGDKTDVMVAWGDPSESCEKLPLTYQNRTIGYLIASQRGANERFNKKDRVLLTTIAALTATTVRAVQLSDEVRQSRQRIVTAREEERRRIRRDLHDGLGPQLASQTLSLAAVAQLISTDPRKARSLVDSLQLQAHEAIDDVRRLVYDLRPPALDDLGLVGALQQSASRYETDQLQFHFDISDMPEEIPAAIETAVFRIAQEAMTNVVRHSAATHCTIHFYCHNENVVAEIQDDGCGLPANFQPGIGLRAMRERAEELNGETLIAASPEGGTCVRTRLPLEVNRE